MSLLKAPMLIWPLFVLILGWTFHRKQNSKDPWTGGPISWPKSLWLANAIYSWFLYPIFLLTLPISNGYLQLFLWAHLVSWWLRGTLELVMIYRWFSWSPKYGITHDLCQIVFYIVLLVWTVLNSASFDSLSFFVLGFGIYMVVELVFECAFARLFLQTRSDLEANENIYFASEDPKWIFVNRLTTIAVVASFAYGIAQAAWLLTLK